jgi:hypothetical protein
MLFKDVLDIHSENDMKHTTTRGKTHGLLNIKVSDTCTW